jgi:hypothetical protein
MSAAVAMSDGEFQGLLGRVEDGLRRAEAACQSIFNHINSWIGWLGPFASGIRSALHKIGELLTDLFREIGKFFTQPGVPWTLWAHGNDWSGDPIGGRVSKLISKSTLDEVRADDVWQGPAADAYKNTLPRQKEALAAIKTAADLIDGVLAKVALAIGAFWIAIAALILSLVVELTVESGAAATGVGAPAAAAGAGISLAKALALLGAAGSALYAFLANAALSSMKDLHQQIFNDSAYPDGHWPRSTSDLSDGSLSDGDTTDWRMRY